MALGGSQPDRRGSPGLAAVGAGGAVAGADPAAGAGRTWGVVAATVSVVLGLTTERGNVSGAVLYLAVLGYWPANRRADANAGWADARAVALAHGPGDQGEQPTSRPRHLGSRRRAPRRTRVGYEIVTQRRLSPPPSGLIFCSPRRPLSPRGSSWIGIFVPAPRDSSDSFTPPTRCRTADPHGRSRPASTVPLY